MRSRGLQNTQANFQRCAPPAAVVKQPAPVDNPFVKIAEFGRSATTRSVDRNFANAVIIVDEESVRRLPQRAAFAADDRQPEEGLVCRRSGRMIATEFAIEFGIDAGAAVPSLFFLPLERALTFGSS